MLIDKLRLPIAVVGIAMRMVWYNFSGFSLDQPAPVNTIEMLDTA